MISSEHRPKSVYVRPYVRWRFDRLEHVVDHFRSYPHQYELFH